KTLYTGFQNTPVDSMATWVTPNSPSHLPRSSRSPVIVPNVRTSFVTCPASSRIRTHATTVFLCTSNPAHRLKITSIGLLPAGARPGGAFWDYTLLHVLMLCGQRRSSPPNSSWFEWATRSDCGTGFAAPQSYDLRPGRGTKPFSWFLVGAR